MNRYRTAVLGILSASVLALAAGNTPAAGDGAQAGVGDAQQAAPNPDEVIRLHSLSSAKLREIMQKIHHWRDNNTAEDLKQPGMDPELLDELVTQVEELLYHAELMSMGLPFTDLNETEMLIFKSLGGELYTEALHIQQLVNNRQIDQLDRAFAQLDRTCQACHQLFRRD
jgi:hypothetical protein